MQKKVSFYLFIGLIIAMAVIGMAMAYVISVLFTNLLVANLLVALLAFGLICFGLTRSLAGAFALERPQRFAVTLSLVSALAIVAIGAFPSLQARLFPPPDTVTDSLIAALQAHTFPLETVQAERGFEDLYPLTSILADKRIVALGEATHGTSEFFRMKHRMVEFLVCEMGFAHFGMETNANVANVLNDYINGGQGNPRDVLYWPWATVEVMDMLDWMRAYNADPASPHRLNFHGIDPGVGERDLRMAANVTSTLAEAGPESKIVLWAHNAHISNTDGRMGSYLKREWGEQAYLLGFEFDHGAFTSRMGTVHTYRVGPASPDYYAYALARPDVPMLFLDFRTMAQNSELWDWLTKPQSSHDLQELHAVFRLHPAWHTETTSWRQLYDGVIFIAESTPAVGLR